MAQKVILLANLGSPGSTSVNDVKAYLDEFLMDERVIDLPYILRFFLVKGIIVPFRAPKSADKYKTIWTKNGSPLIQTTKDLAKLVEAASGMPAYFCMRYGNPSPKDVLGIIAAEHPDLTELVLLPLYPHYAMSSYETAVEHVKSAHQAGGYAYKLSVVEPFFNHPAYIQALAESIQPYLTEEYDHVLFSYHGIPERHIRKSDTTGRHCLRCENCCETPSEAHPTCYRHQIITTTKMVAQMLKIPPEKYSFSFQSRLGTDKWLQPYTQGVLKSMPGNDIKKLVIASPAFVSDCLETLEEIQVEGREDFTGAGGERFTVVPCLNTNALWIRAICQLVNENS